MKECEGDGMINRRGGGGEEGGERGSVLRRGGIKRAKRLILTNVYCTDICIFMIDIDI